MVRMVKIINRLKIALESVKVLYFDVGGPYLTVSTPTGSIREHRPGPYFRINLKILLQNVM